MNQTIKITVESSKPEILGTGEVRAVVRGGQNPAVLLVKLLPGLR